MKREMIEITDPRVTLIGHPAPPWMVNYADLMTELVCFFIVLYALSAALNKDVQQAKKDVEEKMKQEQVQTQVKVDKDGMSITLEEAGDNVFFQSGSAELSPRMKEIMLKLSPILMNLAKGDHDIVVEGHTDNLPIRSGQYPSNWELSTARATSVVTYMIRAHHFPPQRLAAIGYGEFRPLVPNDSDENRSRNRRVVFFIKSSKAKPAAEATAKKITVSESAPEPVESAAAPANDTAAAPAPESNEAPAQ